MAVCFYWLVEKFVDLCTRRQRIFEVCNHNRGKSDKWQRQPYIVPFAAVVATK